MRYNELGQSGLKVSAVGFGAAAIGGVYGETDLVEAKDAVHTSFEMGINYFDTSPYYGDTKSETALGHCIKGLPREELILSTKLGRYGGDTFDFSAQRVVKSVEQSMGRLGVEMIDILNCHDIEFVSSDQIINETLPAMIKLKEQGKVRSLGITGLPLEVFGRVIEAVPAGTVESVLTYCHGSLNDNLLLEKVDYFRSRKIGLVNASPASMALLAPNGPRDWHPAGEKVKRVCKEAVANAQAAGINIIKLAIQYATQLEGIDSCLLGVATPSRVKGSIAWFEEPINEEHLRMVLGWLEPVHNVSWMSGLPENNQQTIMES